MSKQQIINDAFDNAYDTWRSELYRNMPFDLRYNTYNFEKYGEHYESVLIGFPCEDWDDMNDQLIAEYYFYDMHDNKMCKSCDYTICNNSSECYSCNYSEYYED